ELRDGKRRCDSRVTLSRRGGADACRPKVRSGFGSKRHASETTAEAGRANLDSRDTLWAQNRSKPCCDGWICRAHPCNRRAGTSCCLISATLNDKSREQCGQGFSERNIGR